MGWMIVDVKNWQRAQYPQGYWKTTPVYTTEGRAKAAFKRHKKLDGERRFEEPDYKVITVDAYIAGDYEVETINILNPKAGPIMIPRSQKGTCCDPGTEGYHSM